MNKKAISIVTQWIVHLVFLMMVIAIFLGVILKIQDNRLHNLRVEAREFAFTRDMLLATSNQISYNYNIDNNISIQTNNERCLVQAKYKNQQGVPVTFFCSKNNLAQLQESAQENNIRLVKT